jgi:hypothetical protein
MKSVLKFVLASLSAAAAGVLFAPAAQAQSGEQQSSPTYTHKPSLRLRAEVHAEAVLAARTNSWWSAEDNAASVRFQPGESKTRAQVAAEAREAISLGRARFGVDNDRL